MPMKKWKKLAIAIGVPAYAFTMTLSTFLSIENSFWVWRYVSMIMLAGFICFVFFVLSLCMYVALSEYDEE